MGIRGEYGKTEARRKEVIDAAIKVFAEMGFEGSSIREIAREAGMAHTSLLRLFGSKELLYEAVLAERENRVRHDFDNEGISAIEMLRNLVYLAERNQDNRGLTELYSMLSAEASSQKHPAHLYFFEHYKGIRNRLESVFRELEDQNFLRTGLSVRHLAISTIAHFDGIQLQWLIDKDSLSLTEETFLHFETILNPAGQKALLAAFPTGYLK